MIIGGVLELVPVADIELDRTNPRIPASAQAYEYYLRANQLSQQMRDLPLARDFYLRCLEEDARYAPAWARLARCYRILAKFGADPAGNLARAEEAFQRAFALNPDLPGAQCLYAYHETEQGRAGAAIIRLVKELGNHRNDPELYAALVSACRYAGLIKASLAAHELGRRLDCHLRTTVMNTHFVMGDYELALAASTDNVGFMEAMVLDGLGRREEALARVRHREHLPPLMQQWFEMLEAYLEDRREEAVQRLIAIDRQGFDPEGFHYRARLFARLERTDECLTTLERALEKGFCCAPALVADSSFEPLRGEPRFQQIVLQAEARCKEASAALRGAGGDYVLGWSRQ